MKTKSTFIVTLIALAFFSSHSYAQGNRPVSQAAVELNQNMRKLWEDHIVWTRNVILNIIDELPGTNEAVARLLQNQEDIGDAVAVYYGAAAGSTLTGLLNGHINTAAQILVALKNNDAAALAAANTAWYANADSIVDFLAAANPHWDEAELDAMMTSHLDLTKAEAMARHTQNYAQDVLAYDSVHEEILEMADMLSDGIIKQFPNQFRVNARFAQDVDLSDITLLDQNIPNPFQDATEITFFIPETVTQAQMNFYNGNGTLIKSLPIEGRGEGSIRIKATHLSPGVYSYHLVLDGAVSETKKMMH